MRILLLILFSFNHALASAPTAEDPSNFNPDDRETCNTPLGKLVLVFDSPSNRFDNKDTVIRVEYGGKTVSVGLPGAYYDGPEPMAEGASVCPNTPAVILDGHKLIAFIGKNQKPKESVLVGFVFDLKAKKVIATGADLGSAGTEVNQASLQKAPFRIEKTADGVKVLTLPTSTKAKPAAKAAWKHIVIKDGALKVDPSPLFRKLK